MDVFCRCGGCGSCNDETANPMGGKCGNTPQRYTIKSPDVVRHGYRKYCKPCLRRMELARLATKHSLNLGLVLPGAKNNRIVLFGDSITEQSFGDGGFGAALQHEYRRHTDVVLRGYSGYNTAHAVALLPFVFPLDDATPPILVTVCFGANDAVHPGSTMGPVQGCDQVDFATNLRAIAEHLQRLNPPPAVLFITPPPVNSEAWHDFCRSMAWHDDPTPDRDLARTGSYAATMVRVAAEVHAPCVDLFEGLMGTPGWEGEYLLDGLHLTPAGYREAYTRIAAAIKTSFPSITVDTEDAPSDFPDFKTIRASHIAQDVEAFVAMRTKTNPALALADSGLEITEGALALAEGTLGMLAEGSMLMQPPSN